MTKNILLGVLVAIGLLVTGSLFSGSNSNVGGGGTFVTEAFDNCSNCMSTTSPAYLTAAGAATTTVAFKSEGAESFDMNLTVNASTTGTVYLWTTEFSNNNVDWYCEDGKTLTSNILITHGASCVIHSWTPGRVATTSKNIVVTPVNSKYARTNVGVTAANGSVYSQVILKKNY